MGIACRLALEDPDFIYFDAHDDIDTPSTNADGYLDVMGLSMLTGKSWHILTQMIPPYWPTTYKMVYRGLRDVTGNQKETVRKAEAVVIWGDDTKRVGCATELSLSLERKMYSPALVHLDLDMLDETLGKVNGYESPSCLISGQVYGACASEGSSDVLDRVFLQSKPRE